jgi:hypothetical protein
MATGYTHNVKNGTLVSPKQFILQCARAFGACVEQRDDNPNDPPKYTEHNYYPEQLEKTTKKLIRFKKMSKKAFEKLRKKQLEQSLINNYESLADSLESKARYDKMLQKINNWAPPTSAHQGLKDFMQQQLNDSIEWDCDVPYSLDKIKELKNNIENYDVTSDRAVEIAELQRMIRYYSEEAEKEQTGNKTKKDWITKLYASVEGLE